MIRYEVRINRRWLRRAALALLLACVALNGLAWTQAWAMTHYAAGGPATPRVGALAGAEKLWTLLAGVNVPRPANTHTPGDVGLAYTVQRIGLADGEMLEGWFVPRAQPRGIVLLFPGYAAPKESLLAPAASFHAQGYAVLLIDYRGAGGSSGDDTTLGVREGADVARAVASARQTWPGLRLVLYGVSMGSAAVLRAVAHEGAHPDAVILESPFDRLLNTVGRRFDALGLPAFPTAALLTFWGGVQHGSDGFADNPADDARAVTSPALVLYGLGDPLAPPDEAQAVFAGLAGRKQIAGLPSSGHVLLMLAAADGWKQQVGQFLTTID